MTIPFTTGIAPLGSAASAKLGIGIVRPCVRSQWGRAEAVSLMPAIAGLTPAVPRLKSTDECCNRAKLTTHVMSFEFGIMALEPRGPLVDFLRSQAHAQRYDLGLRSSFIDYLRSQDSTLR